MSQPYRTLRGRERYSSRITTLQDKEAGWLMKNNIDWTALKSGPAFSMGEHSVKQVMLLSISLVFYCSDITPQPRRLMKERL